MTGVKVTIKQRPSKGKIEAFLRKKNLQLVNFSNVHRQASILLDRWVKTNFRTQGGNLSDGPWPPFKLGGRRVKGGGLDPSAKLLQDTGRLRLSFNPFANARTAGIGSDLPYSKPHEEGMNSLPVRRMLPKEGEVVDALLNLFEKHAKKVSNAQS